MPASIPHTDWENDLTSDPTKRGLLVLVSEQGIELQKLMDGQQELQAKLKAYLDNELQKRDRTNAVDHLLSPDHQFGNFVAKGYIHFAQPVVLDCDPQLVDSSEGKLDLGLEDVDSSASKLDLGLGDEAPEFLPARSESKESIDKGIQSRRSTSSKIGIKDEENSKLDMAVGIFILMNAFVMFLELQWRGDRTGMKLGLRGQGMWPGADISFNVLEHVFTAVFAVELALRLYFETWRYCKSIFNLFDACLVVVSCIDMWILAHFTSDEGYNNITFFRLVRVARKLSRLVRAVRIVRTLRLFQGLRVLIHACTSFLPSLLWSMILLTLFMVMGGIMLGNLLQEFMADESQDMDLRLWVYNYYGTAAKATYTMYEITFAGSWPVYARPLIDDVDSTYAIFFLIYITVVVFAIIRVVTAIFLREVLEAASNDADMIVSDRMHKKAGYIRKLESLFLAVDTSGDGVITEEELADIFEDPKAKAYLQGLDLEVHEGLSLFHMLDDGDGSITYEEFINGILRFKGQARSIDLIATHLDLKQLRQEVLALITALQEAQVIHQPASRFRRHRTRDLLEFKHIGPDALPV